MIRKTIHMTIAVGLVFSILGVGFVPASYPCGGTCCMQSAMGGIQHGPGTTNMASAMGCCCTPKGSAKDFSQSCPLEQYDFPNIAIFRSSEKPTHTAVATVTSDIQIPPETWKDVSLEVWTVGTGPPFPLFLLNQSFLC